MENESRGDKEADSEKGKGRSISEGGDSPCQGPGVERGLLRIWEKAVSFSTKIRLPGIPGQSTEILF